MIDLGQHHVSLERRLIFRQGQPLAMGERAFDILAVLLDRQGQLVTKDELLSRVWPDSDVLENNLQVHMSALRKTLGEDRDLIRTIPGRGYLLARTPVAGAAADTGVDLPSSAALPAAENSGLLPNAEALIGREILLREVSQALVESAVLTLTGAGGIGKTSLAIHAARLMAEKHGVCVCFVALAEVARGEEIIAALARALGVPDQADAMIPAIISGLRAAPRLIVLDNCEHVVEMAAVVAEHIVRSCPSVKILTTSREPLRIASERCVQVPPLHIPAQSASREEILECPSAQLLLRRMRALDNYDQRDPESEVGNQCLALISEACRQLEGMPLALEMAAIRASTVGLYELVAGLRTHLGSLSAALRTTPHRHQSLHALLAWSYQLLSVPEQQVLERIGHLQGAQTLEDLCEAAESSDTPRAQVMDCVIGLTQKSLLTVDAAGPFRSYRLLETTRACLGS